MIFFGNCTSRSSLSSRDSYNAVAAWLADARSLASPNIVIILCGNKADLEEHRQVTFDEAERFARDNGSRSISEIIFFSKVDSSSFFFL